MLDAQPEFIHTIHTYTKPTYIHTHTHTNIHTYIYSGHGFLMHSQSLSMHTIHTYTKPRIHTYIHTYIHIQWSRILDAQPEFKRAAVYKVCIGVCMYVCMYVCI
jgi:hypothetical protein